MITKVRGGLLICVSGITVLSCFAAERIVRYHEATDPGAAPHRPAVFVMSNAASKPALFPPSQDAFRAANTFMVYTTSEIDQKITDLKMNELNATIAMLKQNVKNLSDANDALSKRIDDLEKKVPSH